jgi:hypothetical protein
MIGAFSGSCFGGCEEAGASAAAGCGDEQETQVRGAIEKAWRERDPGQAGEGWFAGYKDLVSIGHSGRQRLERSLKCHAVALHQGRLRHESRDPRRVADFCPSDRGIQAGRIAADTQAMDATDASQAVLAEVTCSWGEGGVEQAMAVIVHAGRDMLVLEAADPRRVLPPLGTEVHVRGKSKDLDGRLAEHGRAGRFLVSIGLRPVRRAMRLRVSLPGTLRCATLAEPMAVEISDLTTAGCRVRGVEVPVGSQVTLDFTPPARDEPVTVRATVAHATQDAAKPWIGVAFRLVAMRGGR